jgi:DNA-binding PadR family transcriptional regulator
MPKQTRADESVPIRTSTLVVHVLLTLADGPVHAYGIMKEIARRTDNRLNPGPGSIHFTLTKLLEGGMITESASSDALEGDARRRYYALTKRGRALLADELGALEDILRVARSKKLVVQRRG